jgi:hypothetical protein
VCVCMYFEGAQYVLQLGSDFAEESVVLWQMYDMCVLCIDDLGQRTCDLKPMYDVCPCVRCMDKS